MVVPPPPQAAAELKQNAGPGKVDLATVRYGLEQSPHACDPPDAGYR